MSPLILTGVLLLVSSPAALAAQGALPIHVSVGAGVALPAGANSDGLRKGYHLQAALEAGPPRSMAALRLEGGFDRFGSRWRVAYPCAFGGPCPVTYLRERRWVATLSLVARGRPASSRAIPYFIAGVGAYRHDLSAPHAAEPRWRTDFGVNGGAGVRLPGVHAFLEVRGHVVRNATSYIAVPVGIRF